MLHHFSYVTTGDSLFAEGFWLCRGLDLGHSAKGVFAEGQTQEPSAKLGPRQRSLCRGPGPRQTKGPRQNGRMGHGGHWRHSLPSARRQALGKDFLFFFKYSLLRAIGQALGKDFLFFFKYSLPRAIGQALGKDPLCRGPG